MARRKEIKTLIVERGTENCPEVQLILGQMRNRYGRDNVALEIVEPTLEEDPDAHDLHGRRTVIDPTGED